MSEQNSMKKRWTKLGSKLVHKDVMADVRTRSIRQRLLIWGITIATFLIGGGIYLATGQTPAFKQPLSFSLERLDPAMTGIDFVHVKQDVDPIFDAVKPWMNSLAASACVNDINHDGLLDLLLINAGNNAKNTFYQNLGDFKFVKRSIPSVENLNDNRDGYSTDCNFADINNDGYDDLIVMAMSRGPRLFLSVAAPGTPLGRTFKDITEGSGLPKYLNAHTSTFIDVENDGDLDLIIAGLLPANYDEETVAGSPRLNVMNIVKAEGATRVFPNSFGNATNGGVKRLLLNDGSGRFTAQDISKWGFKNDKRWTWDIGTADINRDGYTDLYFANDFGPDDLYLNNKGKSFSIVVGDFPTDVGRDSYKGMDAELADINNDGYPEIYVSNIYHPLLPEGNLLWMNQPDKATGQYSPSFRNGAAQMGVQNAGWGWGGKFVDVDLDGDKDLIVTNGMWSMDKERDYWFRMTRLMGATGEFMSDSNNIPSVDGRSLSGFETSRVFIYEGGRFYNRAKDAGITHTFDGRGVLLADFNLDGRVDVLFVPQGAQPELVRNNFVPQVDVPQSPAFLGLKLSGNGKTVNTNAVGSRIKITPVDINSENAFKSLYYEINVGNGFASQSMLWVVAGLGQYRGLVDIEVWWTDGKREMYRSLKPDQYHKLRYGESKKAIAGNKADTAS